MDKPTLAFQDSSPRKGETHFECAVCAGKGGVQENSSLGIILVEYI